MRAYLHAPLSACAPHSCARPLTIHVHTNSRPPPLPLAPSCSSSALRHADGRWLSSESAPGSGLRVSMGVGGNDAMECDDALGGTPTAEEVSYGGIASPGGASLGQGWGRRGRDGARGHTGGGSGGKGRNGEEAWGLAAGMAEQAGDAPATPLPTPGGHAHPPSCLLGQRWEGEVADVAALLAGLGAHAACEEAAAAAVAADVHRRLSGLAKG